MPAESNRRILALLAPGVAAVPPVFRQISVDGAAHLKYLAKSQQLRGRIYLEDGAIEPWQLSEDGRFRVAADDSSWHVITLSGNTVTGCARLQVFPPGVTFSELGVARSAQARCGIWGESLRASVKAELVRAQREGLGFAEAGGWAIAPAVRSTTEALRIALGSFAIGELLGGCLGLSTATLRHGSASILRRLGAASLCWNGQVLPSYYDASYRCEMEVVAFDSRRPNPKFRDVVEQLKRELMMAPVYCDSVAAGQVSLAALAGAMHSTAETPVAVGS